MTGNDFERMKIILSMKRTFDYTEFLQILGQKGIRPLSINEYAMKVGFIEMAKIKYPELSIEEGYLKIVEDGNQAIDQPSVQQQQPQAGQPVKTGCGTCGGGAVV